METTVKATVIASKLRARIAELKKQRAKASVSFGRLAKQWRADLVNWFKTEGARCAALQTPAKWDGNSYGCRNILDDAPKPPKAWDDTQLKRCRSLLRQIGITGQQTIRMSESEVDRYFKDKEANDDEDD